MANTMNKKETKLFKELLLRKKVDFIKGIEHLSKENLKMTQKDAAGDLSSHTLHMADMATDNFDREFSLTLADNERQTLQRIIDALERLENHTFGCCQQCKKRISKARLKIVPYAEFCVPCQKDEEKQKR